MLHGKSFKKVKFWNFDSGVCCLIFGIWILVLPSYAVVPQTINFQGRLTDATGSALTGTVDLTFKIFDAVTGGTEKWNETKGSVLLDNGVFNVILGTNSPIGYSVFDGTDRWIEITVGTDVLSPRQKLGSVGYAFYSNLTSTATYAINSYNAVNSTGDFTVAGNIFVSSVVVPSGGLIDGVDISTVTFGSGGGWMDDGTVVRLITGTDNVGIGTTAPSTKLEVKDTSPSLRVAADNANTSSLQLYEISAGTPYGYEFQYAGADDRLYLWSRGYTGNEANRMTWQKNGNIGIGTTSPDTSLHVYKSTVTATAFAADEYDVMIRPLNDNYAHVRKKDNSDYRGLACYNLYISSAGCYIDGTDNNNLTIHDSVTVMREVGDTSSAILSLNQKNAANGSRYALVARNTGELAIYDYQAATDRIQLVNRNTDSRQPINFYTGTGSGKYIVFLSSIVGSQGTEPTIEPSTDYFGSIGMSGQAWWRVYAYSHITVSTKISKRDIKKLERPKFKDMYDKVKNIELVTYRNVKKGEDDKGNPVENLSNETFGVIAEDSPKEIVDEGGGGIDLYKYTSLLVGALKEAQERIDQLEARIAELEKKK